MKLLKTSSYILFGIGCLCLLYYLILSLSYGINYIVFSWTWLAMGILCQLIAWWQWKQQRHMLSYLPSLLQKIIITLLAIGICFFAFIEARILYMGQHVSSTQGNTLIVLGAQLNGNSISRLLRYRLDAALAFHKEYPKATIIVSGGQGPGESTSEASAMRNYLVANGVPDQQILMEDNSMNTAENFSFSKKLLKNDTHVSVISNDFHMYRANHLCEESGLTCSLYPARSDFDLAPNFYFREFFGVVKDEFLTKLQ